MQQVTITLSDNITCSDSVLIYAVIEPVSYDVKYIGKTTDLTQLLTSYFVDRNAPDELNDWQTEQDNLKRAPIVHLIESCDKVKGEERKKHYMRKHLQTLLPTAYVRTMRRSVAEQKEQCETDIAKLITDAIKV